ncbi:TPA: SpaH/EbpB family LPXTG-anchored major pilin [Streptococcus suis]|nr:SpaH/EbpB family LPXTG-anchored major pilin [Streptococcus suis]
MKIIKKIITGLMVFLVALGSSPLEVFALPNNGLNEWPTGGGNDVTSTLPQPPAVKNIVDLSSMFNYPKLDYGGIPRDSGTVVSGYTELKSYVTATDSSVAVLTRDSTWQSGVMWSLDDYKVRLNEPFHMVSYVYLGNKGDNDSGADGITFTMHNDKKDETLSAYDRKVLSGNENNFGINAYGALGNGLGIYGNNFSAAAGQNRYVYMQKGVTNGIALEFDTFLNDEYLLNGKQFSDNDLWDFVNRTNRDGGIRQGTLNSSYGHIAINYLNKIQDNLANNTGLTFDQVTKHEQMLSVGWDGAISHLDYQKGWQVSSNPTKKLADNQWHRLEVIWTPKTDTTGDLTYKIYRNGHQGYQNISTIDNTYYDGSDILSYTISDLNVVNVFAVNSTADSVYWGFSGSTGGFQNNQAVQMLQLPVNYYTAELSKVDQDNNPVSDAVFHLEKKNETTGDWEVQEFYNPKNGQYVKQLMTGTQQDMEIGVYSGVFQSLGKIKLTQLTSGTYRWREIAPPAGYQLEQEYYPNENGFLVNYSESLKENAFNFTATNKKLYQLELTKIDSDTEQPLNDVPFIISKTEKTENENDKQYYLKLNADTTGFEWTEVEAEAEQFLSGKSYALDETGKISGQTGDAGKLIVKYFPDAPNLSWKEVSVPAGYDSSGPLTGVFTASTDNKYVYSANQTNSRLYQVSLEKKASDTNAALPGAVFSLQKKVDQNWETVSQDGVSEFTTNSEGKISISNLTAGTYRWEEKQAPVGYKIKQQYFPDENGFEVKYREGLEIDGISQNYKYDPTQVTNEPRDFELILEKLSSTFQRPLENVSFTLYSNREGNTFSNEITTLKTNPEGKIVFGSDLIKADQTYYLVESQTVDGFIQLKGYFTISTSKADGINVTYVKADTETDASPFEFTKTDGDIYSGHLKIYNKRKSILPTTGGNGILQYITIGLSMIALAFLFLLARKRMLKWFIVLLVSTTGLMGLNSGTQKVLAQENNQVTFEVHRLVYQPSDTQYKSGVAVPGAELEILDVTDTFYDLVSNQQLTPKNAQERLRDSSDVKGKSVTTAVTDQSGIVNFSVAKINNQRPAVYLIRETVTPVAVTKMESLVVVLPILDDEGNEKSVIPLYPKSHGTFTFDKTIDAKQSSYSFGEPIDYRLSTIIPQDIANLSSYEIEDIYDKGLQFIPDSLVIFVDGQEQKDITKAVNLSENQFRVVFDVAKLAQFGGKKIEITYNMVIKDTEAIDQDLVNTATLYPGDLTPLVDRENVRTGGFRFIKRAAEGKQNPLAEATFVIKNPTNDAVLTYKEGKYQFEKVATNASGVVRLTSDDEGYFEIKGLRYGEYLVSEVRAPSGYVLNDKPTTFTVDVSTYTDGPVLSIINVKKPKIRLPETGVVVTSTAFVGLFIMASSLVMIRRRKDN